MSTAESNAQSQLRAFVDRIERLEEEKAAIASDIKSVFGEASGHGFDAKILRKVIRLRKIDRAQREEEQALVEIYMAALGMLEGTPLGEAARSRLSARPRPDAGEDDAIPMPEPARPTADNVAAARAEGVEACKDGKRVIDNPYVAGDPRRAAWDEGWCTAAGSDGMDVPAAWRRTKPTKPTKPGKGTDGPADGGDGDGGGSASGADAPGADAPGGDQPSAGGDA